MRLSFLSRVRRDRDRNYQKCKPHGIWKKPEHKRVALWKDKNWIAYSFLLNMRTLTGRLHAHKITRCKKNPPCLCLHSFTWNAWQQLPSLPANLSSDSSLWPTQPLYQDFEMADMNERFAQFGRFVKILNMFFEADYNQKGISST